MTVTEFSNEWDIHYNSIAGNSAPNIDLYEKSVYLTKAQLELVKNNFNPLGNKYKKGFENSSKRRDDLKELVKSYASTVILVSTEGISTDSKFFKVPNDTFLIIQEQAKVTSSDTCINDTYIDVKPKTHDEFNTQIDNPFKKPDSTLIWRLDFYTHISGSKNVELITPYTLSEYKFRYVRYPEPIVLTDLTVSFVGEGLSIDGVTASQTCKLSESIHREVLDRAVELALVDYKPQSAQLKTQIDQRNE